VIQCTFNEKTYKEEFQKADNEIIVKQLEFNEYKIDHDDSKTCIHFCKYFISNSADLWEEADLDLKQGFQKLIFPENISYKKGSFRTVKIAFIFRHLKEKTSPNYCQAPPPLLASFRTFKGNITTENIKLNQLILQY